jgi:parvulin-like peptidyl-prolyl isomerase
MAIPNSILSEKQQLKNTLIESFELTPPDELKAHDKFATLYRKKESGYKEEMDRLLFEYHKSNQISYALGLISVIEGVGAVKIPHSTNSQVVLTNENIDSSMVGIFHCEKPDGSPLELLIHTDFIAIDKHNNFPDALIEISRDIDGIFFIEISNSGLASVDEISLKVIRIDH